MTPEAALIYLGLCLAVGIAGRRRRIGFWGFFFASIIFTPCISLPFLFLSMSRKA
jgi:hypothetical protein